VDFISADLIRIKADILPFFQFLEIVVYATDVFKDYFKEYIHYISDLNFSKNSRQCGI